MKKLNNKISIAGIFLFCTIVVGFMFVQTPLNLRLVPDGGGGGGGGGGGSTTYYPTSYVIYQGYRASGGITDVRYNDGDYFVLKGYDNPVGVWFKFNVHAYKVRINIDCSYYWYVDVTVRYTDSKRVYVHWVPTNGDTITILTDHSKTIEWVKIHAYLHQNGYLESNGLYIDRVIAL